MHGLRVLLLNYEYPPFGGGAAVATEALARALARAGAHVDVITGAGDPSAVGETVDFVSDTNGGRLHVTRVRTRRRGVHQSGFGGAFSYLMHALPTIRRRLRVPGYEVVHLFFSLPTGAILPFLGLRDEAVIVSLRGSDVPGYDRVNVNLERAHRVLRPLNRWVWRRADQVVAVCEALGRLARRSDDALRYEVIRNGVDLELFHPAREHRREVAAPLRCLCVARLIERKGIENLLRAWARLPRGHFRLDIVGDGSHAVRLQEMARALQVDGDVHFHGAVDRRGVAEHYRAADVFVLTPHDEAFGNVFAEALASGLPIVGSNVGGIPELVTHDVNGFLLPVNDDDALARTLQRLADDASLRRTMGRRNRERAEQELGWDAAMARYLDLYARLLHSRSRRAR